MGSRNPSYVIEIETHLSNISDELKKYEKELTSAQRELSNNPANKQLEKTILSLMDKIGDLKESYTSTIRKLSEVKLDSSQFDEFTKRFESSMQEINEKITEVEKKFFELSQGLGSFKGNDKLASQVDGMRRQMKNFMSDMKDAITVVKDLQEVISMKFDDRELQKVDKAISKLQGIDLAVGKSNVQTDDIKQLKKDLMELVYSYEELKGAMNNTSNSPQQTRRIQAEMAENLKQREQIIKKMSQLKGDVNPLNSNYTFTTNGFKQSISKMAQDVESETDELLSTLTDSRTEIAKRVESLADSASTTASSFQFKDGGIRIPVLLDPEAISKLQPEFKSMVDTLNEYAQKNPVDVVFRLFPMSGTRSEENELAKSIKDIRTQIPKTDDEELRGQLDSFVNNLEKQYQQAIKVRIAIELSETADDITKDIEKIKKAAKEANIPIYPTFEISDAESTKLRETLAKIQGDFSFDITDKITSMSESLNKLLSTTNINEWSDAFINALTKVQSKLESMKDLIQPLADLTVSQKVKNGRGRPSKETVENRSYVESFTSAIDALNRALSEKKKLETNTKDFVPNIQADIDKSGQSVMIPVKPKIDGFIEELQTLVDNSGITLGVDGGSGDGGSGGLKSKQSSSKKTVDGINAEATAKKKKIEISKEELQLQDKFNKKLDLYLEKYGEMENATSETKRKAAQNVLFGMSKADPILNRITSRNVSKLDRERLFSEYYQSKTGKTRDWTHYSLDAQYELIQEYAKNKKYNKTHSAGLKKIVENYLSYQEAGGTKTLEGISDNKRVQKNLKNEYEAQTAAIKENEEAKKSNIAVDKKAEDSSTKINKETDAIQKKIEVEKEESKIKKQNEEYSDQDYGDLGSNQPDAKALKEYEAENEQIKKNTQAKEEAVSQTKQQEEAQELMNRLVDAANAKLEAEKQAIDATNTSLEKNNQLKKENASFNIEQQFDSWKKQLAEEGGLDLRTKKGKGNLDWLVNQYNLYKQNGGSRDIAELSDDVNIQKKLKSAYEATTQAIKEVKQAKEETTSTPSTTEANISKIDKENQKLDENIQKTKEDAKAKDENNLSSGTTTPSQIETIAQAEGEVRQESNAVSTELERQNGKLGEQKSLYDQIFERVEKIRILGAVGRPKEDLIAYGEGKYGFESPDTETYRMQINSLKTLTPSGKSNADIRDLVFDPSKTIEEVTKELVSAAEDYQTCKQSLDEMFSKAGIVGGKLYDDAYRMLDNASLSSEDMANVVSDTKAKLGMLQQENIIREESRKKKEAEAQAQAELNKQKSAEPTSNKTPVSTDTSLQESTKQKAKKQGEEVGESVVEGAIEGTKKTQKSDSPSKVAEALGGDWGTGYANGILKSKEEVEAAVRDLVTSGKMTASELLRDIANIGSDEKYKDLLEPVMVVGRELSDANINKFREYCEDIALGYERIERAKKLESAGLIKGSAFNYENLGDGSARSGRAYSLVSASSLLWESLSRRGLLNEGTNPDYNALDEAKTKFIQGFLAAFDITIDEIKTQLSEISNFNPYETGFIPHYSKEKQSSGAWQHFSTIGKDGRPNEKWEGNYTYKTYGEFANPKYLNQSNIVAIMKALSQAGFIGQLKVPGTSDGGVDRVTTSSDQIVIHGINSNMQKIAYEVLRTQFGHLFSQLANGFDKNKTSKDDTSASFSEIAINKGRDTYVEDARKTLRSQQQTSDLKKEETQAETTTEAERKLNETRDQKSTRNSSQQNTENLKKEETQAEATAKANKELSSSRQISSLKGQITKIANQIANDPELTMQKYAEGVTKAAEYINKLKELGAETSEIKQKFLNITENAYQKIKPIDTSESREQIAKEKDELNEMPEAANKASEAKEEFASANKQVLSSIVESLKGLSSEGNAFDGLNKLINNLGGKNGDEKLEKTVNGLKEIYNVLNQDIGENALIRTLNELAGKGTDLEHLATVLKSTKKQVENAENAMDTSMQDGLSSLMGGDVVSENARTFLSQFGDVVNMTQELKNGFVQITSTVLTADNQFKRYILTTKDGINMTVSKTEEHTASLEKQILLYQKLLRASQNFNKVNPNTTSEAFIEKDSEIWKEVVGYAEEYGNDLGEIYSITRSVREVNGELLESFKIIGKNGSVTIGAENDVVGSVQNLGDLIKQLKKLYRLQDLLENISGDKSGKYTSGYIDNVKAMIDQINSESFNITNPEDVTRLNALVDDATELYRLAKDTNNEIGNSRALENIRGKISDILNKYQAMPQTLKNQFEELRERTKNLIDTGATKQQVQEISNEFVKLNANLSESGRKYQGLFAQMFERLRSQSSQLLAQYLSFYDIIRYTRTAITTLIDLDTQLVDLRKTTSMTTTELNQFYKASSDVGKELGVTTSEIISQAAAWSRFNKIDPLYGNI